MEASNLKLDNENLAKIINDYLQPFCLDTSKANQIKAVFEAELEKGLQHGLKGSSLQMENTYVPELTNGKENGKYLALDLGGTNFRVMLLEMVNGVIKNELVEYYTVAEETRLGPGQQLFDFLAQCIADFVQKKLGNDCPEMPLGFTFSFPMSQKGLDQGVLVSWTKSFNASGCVGQDAVKMLNEAIERIGNLKVKVVAILNDATGTLVKGAYDDSRTGIGLILGTGCNGAYLEEAQNVVNWHGDKGNIQEVIIDPEFGAFGDNGCIDSLAKTEVDKVLDADSLLPHSFTYEKYFAGKYLGELVRLVLLDLHKLEPTAFLEHDFKALEVKNAFSTSLVSKVLEVNAKIDELLFNELNLKSISNEDCLIVKHVCQVLSERGALLVAIPMATFIQRMKSKDHVAIAITGSLYKYHPLMKNLLEKHIGKFVPGRKFHTFLSDDGSGKGAGLVAAIAARL